MSLMTKLASRMLGLPPAVASRLECQIDLPIPMPDGTVLLANRIAPRGGEKLPIILIRDPYNSRGTKPDIMSMLIAERGYQVINQNCRGTWGSGGEFQPFRNEREDGLATFEWLAEQPWFSGSVGMFGLSYWGYAQLASGPGAPDYVKALVPMMSASRIHGVFRSHRTLNFNVLLTWHYQTYVSNAQKNAHDKKHANARLNDAMARGYAHLPVHEADEVSLGRAVPFFQEILWNERPDDEFWAAMDHSELAGTIAAPVHLIGGWYDFFLADQLSDYESLRKAGKNPFLTIGPWPHVSTPGLKEGLRESFTWYDAHLRGNLAALRTSPVKVCVMGLDKWVSLAAWPPSSTATSLFLHAGGLLSSEIPTENAEPSRYRYDPADPTPSLGGRVVIDGGPKDNRRLESRKDVLVFTSAPMKQDMTIMGLVSAELHVRASAGYADFYARLCDVSGNKGKSTNICEGIVRIEAETLPADSGGIRCIAIDLFSTAHCFRTGHRIRVQISSGAHPVFIRNPGTGEPTASGTTMRISDQEVFHDAAHPSAIILPMVSPSAVSFPVAATQD